MATGDYQFSAAPRTIQGQPPKYRDPYFEPVPPPPANIMFDRRVVRGNTYAAMIIPVSTQQEIERQQELERKRRKRMQDISKQQQLEPDEQYEEAEFTQSAHESEHMPTNFLEPMEGQDIKNNQTQNKFFIDRPPSPEFIPVENGKMVETQIEDGELFDFDIEVDPILDVIVGKTLEEARMEVIESDELEIMRKHKQAYELERQAELLEVQRVEAADIRRKKEAARRQLQAKTRRQQMQYAHQKFVCRITAKRYLHKLKQGSIKKLADLGVLRDPSEVTIHSDFFPWLIERTLDFTQETTQFHDHFSRQFNGVVMELERRHHEAVQAEYNRREELRLEKLRVIRETEDRKAERREKRQIRQAERERQALFERIESEIVAVGENRERILTQLIGDIDGRNSDAVIGTPGGLFFEFVNFLASVEETQKSELTEEQVLAILQEFVVNWMKCPVFVFANLNQEPFEEFLLSLDEENPVTLEKLYAAPQEIQAAVLEYIRNTDNGFTRTSLSEIWHNRQEYNIREGLIEQLITALFKIMTAPDTEENVPNASRQKVALRLLNYGKSYIEFEGNEQAVVRIRIPRRPVVSPEPPEGPEDGEQKEGHEEEEKVPHVVEMQEIENLLDQTLAITPTRDDLSVFVLHQAAQRQVRNDLIEFFKTLKDLEGIDPEQVRSSLFKRAQATEAKVLENFAKELPVFDFEINQ